LEIPIPNRKRRDRTELVELEELAEQFLMKEQKIEKREEKKQKCVYMCVMQAYVCIIVSNIKIMTE